MAGSLRKARRRATTVVAAAALAASLAACGGDDDGITINVYGPVSLPGFDQVMERCTSEADGRYRIEGHLLPTDADGQREQLVRRLVSGDKNMDIVGIDVTWTPEFADSGWIRELDAEQTAQVTEDTLEPTLQTGRWNDAQYGVPMHTNVQLLWYRESLSPEPPKTWDALVDQAEALEAEGKPHTIGVTAARYEGLVVMFNTLLATFGGQLVNDDGTEAVVDDATEQALATLARIANSDAAMAGLTNAQEPEVYAEMQSGRAAFTVNWPYVYNTMRGEGEANPEIAKVFEDLRFTTLPGATEGEPGIGTLGGRNLAISSHTEHPDEAFEAMMCMRDRESQMTIAMESGEPPTLESIYTDPAFQEAYPMHAELLEQLERAVPRPQTPLYQNVSTILSNTLSPPTAIKPDTTAQELGDEVQRALDGKGILP